MENLAHLVSRMSLHEGEENQPSSYHMLEVPLEAVAVGKDVDNKYMEEGEKVLDDVASQGKRSRKLTEKGWSLKLSTLSNTRRKMNSRLVRQSGTIEDLMYSSKNYMTVEEALAQFDYIFKQLLLVHQEYHSLLEDDEKLADEEWFEEVDERVFTFKHKVYNWLKEAETERSAKKVYSKKGSKSTSSDSSRKSSNSSGSSRCSKERAMEEKAKLAGLMAEVEFMQQRQMAENRAEQLRVQEKLVKAKARSEVYEAMERKGSEVDKSEIIRGLLLDSRLYISIK